MKMEKVMLTVFKSNKSAVRFYMNALTFVVDDFSPDDDPDSSIECDYLILSKLVPAAQTETTSTATAVAVAAPARTPPAS